MVECDQAVCWAKDVSHNSVLRKTGSHRLTVPIVYLESISWCWGDHQALSRESETKLRIRRFWRWIFVGIDVRVDLNWKSDEEK